MTPRTTLLLLILVFAAIGSWYLASSNDSSKPASRVVDTAYRGYYLKNARFLGTNVDGSFLYEIHARSAQQQSDESVELSDVDIEYTPDSEIPWSINADAATLYPHQPRILLQGDVRMRSAEGFSGDDTELRTDSLLLDPDAYTAETEQRVQIRVGDRTLTGTGMLASLKENRMELRSNVRGRFTP